MTRIINPTSSQLENLRRPAYNEKLSICARTQFFGEYLHAFTDTFSHRDEVNKPFYFTSTVGHGKYNHDPDQTYNVREFQTNEMRIFRMAEEMYGQIQSFSGKAASYTWAEISDTVMKFILTGKDEANAAQRWQDRCANPFTSTCDDRQAYERRKSIEIQNKADMLEAKLIQLGLAENFDFDVNAGQLRYDKGEAARRRAENLRGLTHNLDPQIRKPRFPGVLLPGD